MQHETRLRKRYPPKGNNGTASSITTINDEEPQQLQKMFKIFGSKLFMKYRALALKKYTLRKA